MLSNVHQQIPDTLKPGLCDVLIIFYWDCFVNIYFRLSSNKVGNFFEGFLATPLSLTL